MINAPGLCLGVAPGGSNTATVQAGATATYNLEIGGAGDTGNATLSCSGSPAGATCNVPPTMVISDGTLFNATVTTTGSSAELQVQPGYLSPWMWAVSVGVFGMVLVPGGKRNPHGKSAMRKIRILPWLLLLLLLPGCGGSSSNGGGGVTPAGTYTLTVTAKLGPSITQSLPLTLIVK